MIECRKVGRRRLYSFAWTGFMTGPEAERFLHGAYFSFLREAPRIYIEYQDSLPEMTLFWEQ